ncbi:MAG: DUF6249 domain-containing protein [Candidatus Zixiibacteriota bacterium]
MNSFWEMAPLIIFFGVSAYIVKIILEHFTRKKLIEKEMLDENVKYLYADKPENRVLSSLKWGMILIGIGIAVFIGQIVPPELQEEVTIGGMFVLAGLGLVIYYLFANKIVKKIDEKSPEQ